MDRQEQGLRAGAPAWQVGTAVPQDGTQSAARVTPTGPAGDHGGMSAPQQPDGDPARTIGPPRAVITDGRPSQLPDTDPDETQEWLAALAAGGAHPGPARPRHL